MLFQQTSFQKLLVTRASAGKKTNSISDGKIIKPPLLIESINPASREIINIGSIIS